MKEKASVEHGATTSVQEIKTIVNTEGSSLESTPKKEENERKGGHGVLCVETEGLAGSDVLL